MIYINHNRPTKPVLIRLKGEAYVYINVGVIMGKNNGLRVCM